MGITTVEEVLKLVEMVAEREIDYALDDTSHLQDLVKKPPVKTVDNGDTNSRSVGSGLTLEDTPDG